MTIFFLFLFAALLTLILRMYIRDRRYLKKRTSEAMRKEVWEELEGESHDLHLRQQKFHESLRTAREKLDVKKDDW